MQLNNLEAEKEKYKQHIDNANHALKKTGISLTDLQSNEVPIPSSMVSIISQNILRNNLSESLKSLLKAFNFTPERFKQVYMNDDIHKIEDASVGKIGGFNGLENFLPAFV